MVFHVCSPHIFPPGFQSDCLKVREQFTGSVALFVFFGYLAVFLDFNFTLFEKAIQAHYEQIPFQSCTNPLLNLATFLYIVATYKKKNHNISPEKVCHFDQT